MAGLLAAIEASAVNTIEAGEMSWKCRKITSAHLARVGHAALAVAQGMDVPTNGEKAEEESSEDVMAKIAKSSPAQMETMAKLKDAVVAAGLIGVGDPESGEFTDVKVCMDADDANAKQGIIWVGSIPSAVSDAIFTEVMSLSTDGGRSIQRLRSFRERAGNTDSAGPDRETVR